MKTLNAAAFFVSAAIAPALAMPLGGTSTVTTETIQIAGGCGPGFHRGPFEGCRKNFADPAAHPCPRGYHIGPGGGCRGNGR